MCRLVSQKISPFLKIQTKFELKCATLRGLSYLKCVWVSFILPFDSIKHFVLVFLLPISKIIYGPCCMSTENSYSVDFFNWDTY